MFRQVWELSERACTCRLSLKGHYGEVYALSLSADHATLYSSSSDLTIRIWRTKNGQCLRTLKQTTVRVVLR